MSTNEGLLQSQFGHVIQKKEKENENENVNVNDQPWDENQDQQEETDNEREKENEKEKLQNQDSDFYKNENSVAIHRPIPLFSEKASASLAHTTISGPTNNRGQYDILRGICRETRESRRCGRSGRYGLGRRSRSRSPLQRDDVDTQSPGWKRSKHRSRSPRDERELSSKIFVGEFGEDIEEFDLRNMFKIYGEITDVFVPKLTRIRGIHSGKSRGYGFVTFLKESAALEAIEKANGQELNGKKIKVEAAKPRRSRADSRRLHPSDSHKNRHWHKQYRSRSRSRTRNENRNENITTQNYGHCDYKHNNRRNRERIRSRSRNRSLSRNSHKQIQYKNDMYRRRSRSRNGHAIYAEKDNCASYEDKYQDDLPHKNYPIHYYDIDKEPEYNYHPSFTPLSSASTPPKTLPSIIIPESKSYQVQSPQYAPTSPPYAPSSPIFAPAPTDDGQNQGPHTQNHTQSHDHYNAQIHIQSYSHGPSSHSSNTSSYKRPPYHHGNYGGASVSHVPCRDFAKGNCKRAHCRFLHT